MLPDYYLNVLLLSFAALISSQKSCFEFRDDADYGNGGQPPTSLTHLMTLAKRGLRLWLYIGDRGTRTDPECGPAPYSFFIPPSNAA